MNTNTPTPWHIERANGRYELWPVDSGQTDCYIGGIMLSADADHIVHAVNCHASLLEACKVALQALRDLRLSGDAQDWEAQHYLHETFDKLKAAISQAENHKG